jgi:hypothetical protein
MQKHRTSATGNIYGFDGNLTKTPAVLQNYWWKSEEINTDLTYTAWRAL